MEFWKFFASPWERKLKMRNEKNNSKGQFYVDDENRNSQYCSFLWQSMTQEDTLFSLNRRISMTEEVTLLKKDLNDRWASQSAPS